MLFFLVSMRHLPMGKRNQLLIKDGDYLAGSLHLKYAKIVLRKWRHFAGLIITKPPVLL